MKAQLRAEMKQKLENLPKKTRGFLNQKIFSRLTAHPVWREAETVGITVSTAVEMDTSTLIKHGWTEGKAVAVPKVDSNERKMDFYRIRSFDELAAGFTGIPEPKADPTAYVPPGEIDLLIVPGLIFNEDGYRIGFGGGFYDRFLTVFPNLAISLAFELQLVRNIPVEPFDRPVDMIFTEQRVLDIRS